ncbi:MAG: hypothetical protein AMXMBFR77_26940 [Phycisphaerales bacterium]
MPEIEQAIEDNATGPAAASADGVSVTQQRIPDQIAADRYLREKAAGAAKGLGLKRVVMVPPGAV